MFRPEDPTPDAAEHPRWITVQTTRTVLAVVHTMTAWNRLADILPIFDADWRVQIVYTFPDVSRVSGDVPRAISDDGGIIISWANALSRRFDLAISVHHSGELHCLTAPLVLLSHGMGYTKHARRETVYGLSREWLVHDGVIADALILSHDHEVSRLAAAVPEAVERAVVAGDPCLDRMVTSRGLRDRYRHALGAGPDQTVVTVSSTWGPDSLLGRHPELIPELVAALDCDSFVVCAIVHPIAWFAHGPRQLRSWLIDALRGGLRLIAPEMGWQQTILASDAVIGDFGSVTAYAASSDVPTLLATFPDEQVATGSAVDALGRMAHRLDPSRSIPEQIERVLRSTPDNAPVRDLASSRPGRCHDILRSHCYRLMQLPTPTIECAVAPYPPDQLRPTRQPVRAHRLTCETPTSDTTVVRRWPADPPTAPGHRPEQVPTYLAVDADHVRLFGSADVVVITEPEHHSEGRLDELLGQRPLCTIAAAVTADGPILLRHRRLGTMTVHITAPLIDPFDAAVIAVAVHHRHSIAEPLPPQSPQRIQLGPRSIAANIVRHPDGPSRLNW